MTAELGDLDTGALVEDVGEAVEEQKRENVVKAAEIDAAPSPIGDAFGFKKVSIAQARRVRAFMNQCESESGKKGAEALMTFFDNLGVADAA